MVTFDMVIGDLAGTVEVAQRRERMIGMMLVKTTKSCCVGVTNDYVHLCNSRLYLLII